MNEGKEGKIQLTKEDMNKVIKGDIPFEGMNVGNLQKIDSIAHGVIEPQLTDILQEGPKMIIMKQIIQGLEGIDWGDISLQSIISSYVDGMKKHILEKTFEDWFGTQQLPISMQDNFADLFFTELNSVLKARYLGAKVTRDNVHAATFDTIQKYLVKIFDETYALVIGENDHTEDENSDTPKKEVKIIHEN